MLLSIDLDALMHACRSQACLADHVFYTCIIVLLVAQGAAAIKQRHRLNTLQPTCTIAIT